MQICKVGKRSDRALQERPDIRAEEFSTCGCKGVQIRGRERAHVAFSIVSVRLAAMAASFEVRLAKLLGQFLRETEGDFKSVRRPDRQNAKIVAR
jgi:hypothetical protein